MLIGDFGKKGVDKRFWKKGVDRRRWKIGVDRRDKRAIA